MHEGLDTIPSNYSVDETVTRLLALLEEKGIKLFALVDHSGEAAAAGLTMRPTKLLIFGNPKAGTPLMLAEPLSALDLPLKSLVTEATPGEVMVSFNAAAYILGRHSLPGELLNNLAPAEHLIAAAVAT